MKVFGFWLLQCSLLLVVILLSLASYELVEWPSDRSQDPTAVLAAVDQPVDFFSESDAPDPLLVHSIINEQRSESSHITLATHQKLALAAQQRALDMQRDGYYAHVNPATGGTFVDSLQEVDFTHSYACENLNLTFSDDPWATVEDWLQSPSHKACLMSDDVRYAGYASVPLRVPGQQDAYIVVAVYANE